MPTHAVCRGKKRDMDFFHCSQPFRLGASLNVRCNGIGISRQGHINTLHTKPGVPCPSHVAPIAVGSLTVRVNGMGCGRVGDYVTGCTFVATGSSNVFAG